MISGPNANTEAGKSGAYLFERVDGEWTRRTRLPAPGLESGAEFGRVVDISGDDALVGAPVAYPKGRAYTLSADENWYPTRQLVGTGQPESAEFGTAVALSGTTALVGAPAFGATTGAFLFDA